MNNLIKRSKQGLVGLCGAAALAMGLMVDIQPAAAHGERSQEPFLRMRTIQWYDMKWGPETTKVNDFGPPSGVRMSCRDLSVIPTAASKSVVATTAPAMGSAFPCP